MAASVTDRLCAVAEMIDRLGIDQDRILSAEVIERERTRVHVERGEFFAKLDGPHQRRLICEGRSEMVSRLIDSVELFCVVDAAPADGDRLAPAGWELCRVAAPSIS